MEEKFQVNHNFIFREIAGEFVLIPTGKELENFNGLVTLNETAVFVWKLLAEKRTLQEIIRSFLEEYESVEDECVRDVKEFLEQAVIKHIILRCG